MNPQQNFRNPRLVVVVSMLLLCDVIVVVVVVAVVVVEIRACFGQVAGGVDSKEPGLPNRPPTSKLLHELKSFASTEAGEEVGC